MTMPMSTLALFLLATFGLHSAVAASQKLVTPRCSGTPNVDWSESVHAFLRKIPSTITAPSGAEKNLIMGFRISAPEVTGLDSLWTFKPLYSFCVSNETLIEAVVFVEKPLTISANWKSCTGSRGKLGTKVSSSKLRLYFKAEPTPEEPEKITLLNIEPDSLDDAELFLEGASRGWRIFVDAVSFVLMPHLELFWSRLLRVDAVAFLRE
uniref:Putative secreted protein n=1 Tax=Amblyomma cajennense TaxID=34607 RepID=A0A023FDV8_AMBCJ